MVDMIPPCDGRVMSYLPIPLPLAGLSIFFDSSSPHHQFHCVRAHIHSTAPMGLWSYYRSLSPRTRLYVGGGVIIYSLLGIAVSNKLEQKLDLVPTEADKAKLSALVPHVRTVDRNDPTSSVGPPKSA